MREGAGIKNLAWFGAELRGYSGHFRPTALSPEPSEKALAALNIMH
jgi:hypothetical protein